MSKSDHRHWKTGGMRRLINAGRHQLDGVIHGLRHDAAIRQVSMAAFGLCMLALLVPVSKLERLLLILPVLLVVLVEYLNSAIEAVVDRISTERHPLSKVAKDYASVAVAIAVMMSLLTWIVILGPLALSMLGK